MLVAREKHTNMVGMKQGHVGIPQGNGRRLYIRSAVWTRREWSLMTKNDDIDVPSSVKCFELALDPLVLFLIVGNIRVECHNERVPIRKRIGGIAFQASR